jgi:hypothetical protein
LERIFKLPLDYDKIYLEELLLLVKYGNFTRTDVREMPIAERKFFLNKLIEYNKSNVST